MSVSEFGRMFGMFGHISVDKDKMTLELKLFDSDQVSGGPVCYCNCFDAFWPEW